MHRPLFPSVILSVILCGLAVGAAAMAPTAAFAQAEAARGITVRALAHQARVLSALDQLMPPERSVPQVGIDVDAPTFWRPLRLRARMLQATGGSDDLHSMEAGVVLGGTFAGAAFVGLEGAYARRGSYSPSSGLAHDRIAEFARAGVRAGMALGGTGFSVHLRASTYVPTWRAEAPEDDIEGWDGETGLSYTLQALPLSASLGYRLERFRIFGVEQEVSALTLAVGFTLLGK